MYRLLSLRIAPPPAPSTAVSGALELLLYAACLVAAGCSAQAERTKGVEYLAAGWSIIILFMIIFHLSSVKAFFARFYKPLQRIVDYSADVAHAAKVAAGGAAAD